MPEIGKCPVKCGKCSGYEYGEEVEVRCEDGAVRGRAVRTCYGPQFVRFAGVPYAKPPLGPLRFLPPIPLGRWENTVDATTLKDPCWSYDVVVDEIYGTEDCLYTTIYTPNVRPAEPMPVMVWIGGWDFYYDNHKLQGPGWLTDQRVVVVYVSYRLGPFGFLSIREATAPGNCGLKDAVMALRWVQRNISSFGGDPCNVTIFGSQSGASMVHYMVLSPMATGLFHKAILHSGSALHHWASGHHPLSSARALAAELNIDNEDLIQAVENFRHLSAEEIMIAFANIIKRRDKKYGFYTFESIFKPCVEIEFEGQHAFLTQSPYCLLKSGKFNRVPLIIGSNRQEGSAITFFEKSLDDVFEKLNLNLSSLVPRELRFEDASHGSKILGNRLLQFYVRGEKLTKQNCEDFFNFLTDYYFTYYINRCVKIHYDNNPTFYYILEASPDCHMPEDFDDCVVGPHASLGTELVYLFQIYGCAEYSGGGEYNRIRQKLLKLWTNFARYGNPTPDEDDRLLHVTWDPVRDSERINYLSIGTDLTKGCNPFYERMSFWDAVLDDTNYLRIIAYFDKHSSYVHD